MSLFHLLHIVSQLNPIAQAVTSIKMNLRKLSKSLSSKITETKHAVVSTFDLFSIGIGPSSSHTVGPMRAAKIFVEDLEDLGVMKKTKSLRVDLYGSLAMTGVGHGTPNAVLMGLEGERPELVDPSSILSRVERIYETKKLQLNGTHEIDFSPVKHLVYHFNQFLPQHPNGMRISSFDQNGDLTCTNEFFSIGGGFVVNEKTQLEANAFFRDKRTDHTDKVEETAETHVEAQKMLEKAQKSGSTSSTDTHASPAESMERIESKTISAALPFYDAQSLMKICEVNNISIAQVVFQNELHWRSADEVTSRILHIWDVMNQSIQNGISSTQEYLPGGLRVKRRAPGLHQKLMRGLAEYAGIGGQTIVTKTGMALTNEQLIRPQRSLPALDWISMYALAVNEENASGGRVVTSPTNGAAGIIPAVLKYYLEFICPSPSQKAHDTIEFLLTASAIGMLYKRGASISAAEMGCQGEVGVACSMAAGAFAAVMGGTTAQIENAAEIGMEHNLGLTCDPPMGLVVIPCIERNALGAVTAVTAAQLALHGDGIHRVTLDQVIATMRQTGIDMQTKYKETSEGGLAVNVPVC